QHLDEEAIDRILASNGIKKPTTSAADTSDTANAKITANRELAHSLGITATPTFVIAGKIIAGAKIDEIERAISDGHIRQAVNSSQ
ncbi:MAG: DsbA family protein, partial [Caulobacteraceae bacterium]